MIRITYTEEQTALAERICDDLSVAIDAPLPMLIVLVSAASNADPVVQAELAQALAAGERILPILTDGASPPPALDDHPALDFSHGYSRERLLEQVARRQNQSRRAAPQQSPGAAGLRAAGGFDVRRGDCDYGERDRGLPGR